MSRGQHINAWLRIEWPTLRLAVALALTVTIWDVWFLGLPVRGYFSVPDAATTPLAMAWVLARKSVGLVAIFVVQTLFFWATLTSPLIVRCCAVLLFSVIAFIEYGFVFGAGGVMTVHDVSMTFQNLDHAPGMISAFTERSALVPTAICAVVLVTRRLVAPRWLARWAVVLLVTFGWHGIVAASFYGGRSARRGEDALVPAPMSTFEAMPRTLTLFVASRVYDYLKPLHRQTLAYRATTVPRQHIVFVIDESMSGLHLSVNGYPRPTTPWLEELQRTRRLTNWGPIPSAATYSDASVCALLTGFNAYPDRERRVLTLPTVFQYARAMNYRTHLLDAELDRIRFGLGWSDLSYVDDWRDSTYFRYDVDSDRRLARAIREILKQPGAQFVVALKRGNHDPPEDNYPPGTGPWKPSRDGSVPAGHELEAVTNTYDNAVLYNLDPFFRLLLEPDGSLPGTVVLYTSDHAEALGADGPPFERKVAVEVTTVPLLMFGDDRPPADTSYRAGHHNLFATLLDMMQVPDSVRVWPYGRSLLRASASDRDLRQVFGGSMFGDGFFYRVADYDTLPGRHVASAMMPH